MARRGGGGGGMGGGGMMAPILSIATGLIIFVVLVIFAPTIAGSIEQAQPALKEICASNTTAGAGTVPEKYVTGQCGDSAVAAGGTGTYNNGSSTVFPGVYFSDWNKTDNTDVPDGVDIWTTNVQILGVVILIISIAVAMYFLKGMA